MGIETSLEKCKHLEERVSSVNESKIRLGEKYKAAKEKLNDVVKKSQDLGYDPKNLKEIKEKKQVELDANLNSLEKDVAEQEAILASIEV